MKRPTIKQLQDLAFALHSKGLEYCMSAHTETSQGSPTANAYISRGRAASLKEASEQIRLLIDPPKKVEAKK